MEYTILLFVLISLQALKYVQSRWIITYNGNPDHINSFYKE